MASISRRCGIAALLLLAGCGPSPEQIVTSVRHCTPARLSPDLMMRLSSYAVEPDSVQVWVVQACHSTGTACSPIASYRHAPPPAYALAGDTVTLELLGGTLHTHADQVRMTRPYRVRVHVITGNVGERGVAAFSWRIRHICPLDGEAYPRPQSGAQS